MPISDQIGANSKQLKTLFKRKKNKGRDSDSISDADSTTSGDSLKKTGNIKIDDWVSKLFQIVDLKSLSKNIESCFQRFMQVEVLEMDNAWFCDKCSKPTPPIDDLTSCISNISLSKESSNDHPILKKAFRRYLIFKLPQVLVLHLKRFNQSSTFGTRNSTRKLNDFIPFQEILDLSEFIADQEIINQIKNHWKVIQPVEPLDNKSTIYHLYAIIVHQGSIFGGHYISYCKVSRERLIECNLVKEDYAQDEWVFFSDSQVRLSNWQEVSKVQAFMFFYNRQ